MANLDAAFSALADPTRRAILARLALGEATVMELVEPFEMTQPGSRATSRCSKVPASSFAASRARNGHAGWRHRPLPKSINGSRCCAGRWKPITAGSTKSSPR